MRVNRRTQFTALLLAFFGAAALAPRADAATYLPLSDADLARRAPVIVLAEVMDEEVASLESGGSILPFTRTRFKALEVLKGSLPDEIFAVRVPGGRIGKIGWSVPGRPSFLHRQQVLLFLHPLKDTEDYALSEFALSKFDVLEDEERTLYAVRSTFDPPEERYLSGPDAAGQPVASFRELEPFLQGLRQTERKQALSGIRYRVPAGPLRAPRRGLAPLWVNVIGREPGECGGRSPCLARWCRDTGDSPMATVRVTGAQTNLSDGSNGSSAVAQAVTGWTSIPNTQVPFAGPGASGNVEVLLDQETHPAGAWTTPLNCLGGILGVGGPLITIRPVNFKGGVYYPAQSGQVFMRKETCANGYPANLFASAMLHEVGHVVGLGHPNQAQSVHSTTGPAEWNAAVMRSSAAPSIPTTPQTDDIQGIQYYYGTQQPPGPSQCVADANTLCLSNGRFRVTVEWRRTDGTSGLGRAVGITPDTGYFWFFDAANIEMVIKVLNACSFASRVWVFAGGLTNVMVTITVTDTQTGAVQTYINPQGTAFQPVQHTSAFSTCP